ncbi:MAG: hypothetical protein BHW22_00165 [Eubacterium sp. CAG76_36_125]|nr:MAG: hypothetical protein BHW22_00165 [Eubacterium sp. CAG76_36_125]
MNMNVIDARDIFKEKKIRQKDIEDKQSIMNIENATIKMIRLYLQNEDFTEHQIEIVVDLYRLFTMK